MLRFWELKPWHFHVNSHEILAAIPWGAIWIAAGAFDPMNHQKFEGIEIIRYGGNPRVIPRTSYRTIFRYETGQSRTYALD